VVDTLAAGDTFNAAVIAARCRGRPLAAAVDYGCRIAGHKCGISGLRLGDLSEGA
jgi:ketohexokinase